MRQINKPENDIQLFNAWAKAKKLRKWKEDFSAPMALFYKEYKIVRDHVANMEQCGLSAYTEKPLGLNIHIDHFRKRDMYPHLTFDYGNMVVDDLNDNYGACFKDNHAGAKRTTFEGREKIFCPVKENMADFIEFMFDGKMIPKQGLSELYKERVSETIRILNLNHKSLKDIRRDIINMVIEYRRSGFSDNEIKSYLETMGFPSVVAWALNIPLVE